MVAVDRHVKGNRKAGQYRVVSLGGDGSVRPRAAAAFHLLTGIPISLQHQAGHAGLLPDGCFIADPLNADIPTTILHEAG
jgi:hypothetical protein